MAAEERVVCPLHEYVKESIAKMTEIQKDRPCGANTARIEHLEKADVRLEKDSDDQWLAINNLRRLVYMGAGATGVLAFLGSILGAVLKK